MTGAPGRSDGRLTRAIAGCDRLRTGSQRYLIGVLRGEGVGPEVVDLSLSVLARVSECTGRRFELRFGGSIGASSERECGKALTPEIIEFCRGVFSDGGAVLCGPGGSRFVYELRAAFDLYCKLVPIRPHPRLQGAGVMRADAVADVDVLVVRENAGGVYFGSWSETEHGGGRRATHTFHYDTAEVERIIATAVHLARQRRGRLCMVHKPAGIPAVSRLWSECADALVRDTGVELEKLEIDTACYRLLADARTFDVVVAPNLFGDVLADGAALLLGSRGMSYSANYSADGAGVYQTAHGAAYDIAGRNIANPLGQVYSLSMMLRETFQLDEEGRIIEGAIDDVLAAGWRTRDIAEKDCRVVGTREFGERLCEAVDRAAAVASNGEKPLPAAL